MSRGRGSLSNLPGRFLRTETLFEDGECGVGGQQSGQVDARARPTHYHGEQCKSLIVSNRSPDLPFQRSINPYRGCEHGCIYCYARPTHSYLELSPGLDFETEIFCKDNAAAVLRAQLEQPGYRCEVLALGTATDPYQPIERRRKLTRQLLALCLELRQPVMLITKSNLVLRDLDLLAPMAAEGLVTVAVSVTTLDNRIKSRLEPRATAGSKRLEAIGGLSAAGVPVSLLYAPVIPFINDHELEAIVAAAADAGAGSGHYVMLRLPHEVNPLWQQWLAAHYPDRAGKVMAVLRDLGDGREYQSDFFRRQRGQGPWAALIAQRFGLALKRHGLTDERVPLRTDLFVGANRQWSLF
ncbi:PA0069 family radical SAM protein [Isoalcanivorax beigongshangi]|uniref:PA0069 family radical SAM protein n=1 Tax=Isoalcanivorax beigongshangi TaxID=3238810 RepID=A0ABV4AFC7_9GAMM